MEEVDGNFDRQRSSYSLSGFVHLPRGGRPCYSRRLPDLGCLPTFAACSLLRPRSRNRTPLSRPLLRAIRPPQGLSRLHRTVYCSQCRLRSFPKHDLPGAPALLLWLGWLGGTRSWAGTVRDVFGPSERSKAQALYGLGPQGGPVIGGVIGGALLQALGWRWLLWIATITSGVTTVATAILLPETYGPYLLKQKPASQRNGERDAVNEGKTEGTAIKPRDLFFEAMKRPLRILFTAPICTIPSLYMSL